MTRIWEQAKAGRHLVHVPGPTNIPDRIRRASTQPPGEVRDEGLAPLLAALGADLSQVFGASGPVLTFPGSGTGACEAALTNTLSPGDRILMAETGHFAQFWRQAAIRLGLDVVFLPGDWRHGADPEAIATALLADRGEAIRAVAVVHNETSNGVASRLPEIRAALDRVGHPALLLVDSISGLAAMEFRQDAWGIDVAIASSQKGLMLPPGLGINAVSRRALDTSRRARLPRFACDWHRILDAGSIAALPHAPPVALLRGLRCALDMLLREEGLQAVFRRHRRLAEATRCAARAWGLPILCARADEASPTVTAIEVPEGCSADALRQMILTRFDMSLGSGLGHLADRVFRIAHLGALDDASLIAALGGVEMGLGLAGIPHRRGGVQAALDHLAASTDTPADAAAGPSPP